MEKTLTNLIKSLVISTLVFLLVGYVFSNITYYTGSGFKYVEIHKKTAYFKELFNYKLAFISSSLVMVFFMFVFYDETNKTKINNLIFEYKLKFKNTKKPNSKDEFELTKMRGLNSIQFNEIFIKYFSYNGKISRGEFLGFSILLHIIFYSIISVLMYSHYDLSIKIFIIIIYVLIKSRLVVLRLHDMGLNGWISLLYFISFAGGFFGDFIGFDTGLIVISSSFFIMFNIVLLFSEGPKRVNEIG